MGYRHFVAEFDTPAAPALEIVSESDSSGCEKREPYALMVLGDSMEPEFNDHDIIIIEPDHPRQSGSFVIAWHHEEYIFRQLRQEGEEWWIDPLNPAYPSQQLSGLAAVKGVITQKKWSGGRQNRKQYS